MRFFFQWLIRLYQWFLSPLLGPKCRYIPSCSHYAHEALEVHGFWRGSWMAIKRVASCHPFAKGGFDAVPPKKD